MSKNKVPSTVESPTFSATKCNRAAAEAATEATRSSFYLAEDAQNRATNLAVIAAKAIEVAEAAAAEAVDALDRHLRIVEAAK